MDALRDRGDERRLGVLQQPAAEHDVEHLLLEPKALRRDAHVRDDLGDEPGDDRRGDGVVRRELEDERRELQQAPLRQLPAMDRLRDLRRSGEAEVRRHARLEQRPRAAPVLAARREVQRVAAEVARRRPSRP